MADSQGMAEQRDATTAQLMEKTSLWTDVIDWYNRILELPLSERLNLINTLQEESPNVYTEVLQLLEEEEHLHPLLQNHFSQWNETSDDVLLGSSVGPYLLESVLGRGGMGTVFLGKRTEGEFDQKVAIKMVRPGIYSDRLLAQFKEERRILAGLSHPSVARLYDGGTTSDDRLYFIMEYIEGQSVDDYIEQHKFGLKDRLNLFQKICDGIIYAHNKAVLHLDIKPENILITENGNPKILDFGISKKMIEDKSEGSGLDPVHHFSMAFASPEQLNKGEATAQSDIYALGTLLFYLVTDVLPFGGFDMTKKDYLDARTNQKPALASEVSIGFSKKKLEGDLNDICKKALQLDADQRYETVYQLKEDIEAHLNGYPISLKTEDKSYVFKKFLKRNLTILSLVSIAFLSIAGLVTYYTISLQKEKNKAVAEASKKREVIDLMTGLFAEASPYEQQGEQITVDTFMYNATEELLNREGIDPSVKGEMLAVLGDVFSALADYHMADSLLHIADGLYKTENVTGQNLADLYHKIGNLRYFQGEYQESVKYLELCKDFLNPGDDIKLSVINTDLGHIAGDLGEPENADSLYTSAAKILEKHFEPPHPRLAEVYTFLGISKRYLLKHNEAEEYYLKALDMLRQMHEEPHTEIAYTLNHIASNYYDQSKFVEAEKYARMSLEQREKILGPHHIETIASASNVARSIAKSKRYLEAIPAYYTLVDKMENLFGTSHNYVSSTYSSLANCYRHLERWDSAMYHYDKALVIFKGLQDPPDSRKGIIVEGLGLTYYGMEEYEKALPLLEENLELKKIYNLPESPQRGLAEYFLGRCLEKAGQTDQALEHFREAQSVLAPMQEQYPEEVASLKKLVNK